MPKLLKFEKKPKLFYENPFLMVYSVTQRRSLSNLHYNSTHKNYVNRKTGTCKKGRKGCQNCPNSPLS
jgi:hypothetical protein